MAEATLYSTVLKLIIYSAACWSSHNLASAVICAEFIKNGKACIWKGGTWRAVFITQAHIVCHKEFAGLIISGKPAP